MNNQTKKSIPPNSPQVEKFSWVTDPAILKKARYGKLLSHNEKPRFIGSVDLKNESLKLIDQIDNINAWTAEHPIPGKHPQAAMFELISAAIDWARNNLGTWNPQNKTIWVPLPKEGFFRGRPATLDDVKRGEAYFVLENGQPIDIEIPQYAIATNTKTHEPFPFIILQAEQAPTGDRVAAYWNLRTKEKGWGYFDSFILLGQNIPDIEPARITTPPYETLQNVLKYDLSAGVSIKEGVNTKRDFLRNNQEQINEVLDEGFKYCSPLESFTLLDDVKSLVSRELLLNKRFESMGRIGQPHVNLNLHGTDVDQTCSSLEDDPEICIFSLYQSPTEEFFGFFLFVEATELRAEFFPIATGFTGHKTAEQLRKLIGQKMWKVPKETEDILFPLLELFGSSIIPRLQRLGGARKLILIPHRWTHILPLHMMMVRNGDSVLTVDDVTSAITYVSSLTSFQWGYNSSLSAVKPEKAKLALVCCINRSMSHSKNGVSRTPKSGHAAH